MTAPQAVQCYNFDEHILLRHPCTLSQPYLPCADKASVLLPEFSSSHSVVAMTQSTPANQYQSDSYMQSQPWATQSASARNVKSLGSASVNQSSGMAYPLDGAWSGATGISGSFDWHSAIQQAEPYIVRESDSQFVQNNGMPFNSLAAQDLIAKGFRCAGQEAWAPSELQGLPHGGNAVFSSAAMRTSISPKSYDSDEIDNSYSPGPMPLPDQASWQGVQTSPHSTELSSPKAEPCFADARLAALPQMGEKTAFSFGRSPWYGLDHFPSSGNEIHVPRHSAPQARPQTPITQARVEARFQVPRSPNAQAQRDYNDRILLEGKRRGETYKEIKQKLVGESPAESTLRGRYRSLTKARRDRVRRPLWTKVDIDLLTEAVKQEFSRAESSVQNPCTLSVEQKISKASWKKVADYIAEHGGSYHFGNSTCKKKWLELNPSCK